MRQAFLSKVAHNELVSSSTILDRNSPSFKSHFEEFFLVLFRFLSRLGKKSFFNQSRILFDLRSSSEPENSFLLHSLMILLKHQHLYGKFCEFNDFVSSRFLIENILQDFIGSQRLVLFVASQNRGLWRLCVRTSE